MCVRLYCCLCTCVCNAVLVFAYVFVRVSTCVHLDSWLRYFIELGEDILFCEILYKYLLKQVRMSVDVNLMVPMIYMSMLFVSRCSYG